MKYVVKTKTVRVDMHVSCKHLTEAGPDFGLRRHEKLSTGVELLNTGYKAVAQSFARPRFSRAS